MSRDPLWVIQAGTVPYDEAVALQERIHAARREGSIPDVLLLLQHPAVITLGRSAHAENLLVDRDALERRGVQVRESARGGDVTYHGPGQLVGYPILDLTHHGKDVHRYLRDVEETLIRTLAAFGLQGERVPKLTGVWVGNEKVAAIGVGVRHWVTWHGFALNVSTDMDAFKLIVPCGISDRGVTSLERLLDRTVAEPEVIDRIVTAFGDVFNVDAEPRRLVELPGYTSCC